MPTKIESCVEAIVTWHGNTDTHNGVNPAGERSKLQDGDQLVFDISSRTRIFRPKAMSGMGMFEVSRNRLLLSNFTTFSTFAIENLEGGAELIKVRPRRLGIEIPFEMSRILIPSGSGIAELSAFSPPPAILGPDRPARAADSDMFRLDVTSKYFAVLVTLCEPRLRGSSMAAVPSVQEVVERLKSSGRFTGANRSNINYHIDYLADQKLPISHWAKYVDGGRMHSKREALVAFALRFDLVREEHLTLLPALHVR